VFIDGEVGTTKGGEESYDVSGHVNLPLNDSFAVRLVGFYSLEGGYVDNVLGPTLMGDTDNANVVEDDWNDAEVYGGRVAARWQINPKWETTLSFVLQNASNDGTWETDGAVGDYKTTRFFDEYLDDDWWQGSLNVKGDLGFAELSITGSYFDRKIKYEWDNMVYDQYRSATTYYAAYDTGLTFGTNFNNQKQTRYSYEVRLTSLGESRFEWMAGAFYEKVYDWWHDGTKNPSLTSTPAWEAAQKYACYAAYYGYDVACPLPETDLFYSHKFDRTIKQKALFGELTYSLTDKWSVTGGMRWFEYDRNQVEIYNAPLGLPAFESNATLGRVESQGKSSDTVFKFATEYKFDADRMVYLLYSEGFRLGGSNDERVASTGLLPREYNPDKMKNYEAGLKSKWWDGKLLVNASLFYMQWDDIQRNQAIKAGCSTVEVRDGVINIGDVVTFYAPTGEDPPAYRDVVDIVRLQNIIYNIDSIFSQKEWAAAPLIPDGQPTANPNARKPSSAKAAMAGMVDKLGLAAILSDPKASKKLITAVISSINPKRLDVDVPVWLSGNSKIKSTTLRFSFFFGTPLVVG
jgi:outer membrane receptor protein involved in Fe transport